MPGGSGVVDRTADRSGSFAVVLGLPIWVNCPSAGTALPGPTERPQPFRAQRQSWGGGVVGCDNEIIDGEVRFEAARLLGLDAIPCVRIDHLSPDEQRVLRLAVNRLAEKGEWDLAALKVEFEELILMEAPIEIAG